MKNGLDERSNFISHPRGNSRFMSAKAFRKETRSLLCWYLDNENGRLQYVHHAMYLSNGVIRDESGQVQNFLKS